MYPTNGVVVGRRCSFVMQLAFLLMALCVPLVVPDRVLGQAAKPASTVALKTVDTNIGGLRALLATPAKFDPEKASVAELESYGLPPMPDQKKYPQAFQAWSELAKAARDRVTPNFTEAQIFHRPAMELARAKNQAATGPQQFTNMTWSGFVISDSNNVFNQPGVTSANYTVPGVEPCATIGPRLWMSQWVGVDGYGSPDVLQVGTSSDMNCPEGANDRETYYAWVEWYPLPTLIADRQVPLFPGDSMLVSVNVISGRYVVTLHNSTRHKAFSMVMTPKPGTQLIGNSIEWVVERPMANNVQTDLSLYDRCAWLNMQGYYQQGALIYRPSVAPSGTVYALTMVQNGAEVSTPTLYPGPANDAAWITRDTIW
jgi:Peptidase A4 family